MTMLLTLDEAKAHLRVMTEDEDDDITAIVEEASAAVLGHIGDAQYLFLDTGGDELTLDPVTEQEAIRAQHIAKRATRLLVADFYRNREGSEQAGAVDAKFGYGYLPRAVVAVLYPLRTPTIA